MATLNKDGLIPGQAVDADTILRVNRERKLKEVDENAGKAEQAIKPKRKPSANKKQ